MPREVLVGNGRVTVALDSRLRVRDFFYPRAGLENHLSGHELKVGVWSEGRFRWVGEGWDIAMRYLPDTMVSACTATNKDLGIELEMNDAVHSFLDVFLRKVVVRNSTALAREVRVLFSHDFHIYGVDSGDTAMYEPATNSLVHYKRERYFLINGRTDRNAGIHQFATGYKESAGREGTWRDAEDGILEGNPIAQGAVDSSVSFKLDLQPNGTGVVHYWIACGEDLDQVQALDSQVKKAGVERLLLETENYWSAWLNRQTLELNILPRAFRSLFKTSLLLMRAHVDGGGAIIASCDSDALQFNRDTYAYVWPRDGAVAAMAFDLAGFQEVSRPFFLFCNDVMTTRGFFNHKYLSDGSAGSSWHALVDSEGRPQLPVQEDETALVLIALWRHFQRYRDLEFIAGVYPNLVLKAADFLLEHRDPATGLPRPSFDLWEEKMGVFTSTAASVCAALDAAAKFARVFYDSERHDLLAESASRMKGAMLTHLYDARLGRFIKALYRDGSRDTTIDSSLAFLFAYGAFGAGEEAVVSTMNAVERVLWIDGDIGGLARYENDSYYQISPRFQGNPWYISTLWLARWYIARAASQKDLDKALELLKWAVDRASGSGVLAEQLDPLNGRCISVSPLVWSHAEFVVAVCEYLDKFHTLSAGP